MIMILMAFLAKKSVISTANIIIDQSMDFMMVNGTMRLLKPAFWTVTEQLII